MLITDTYKEFIKAKNEVDMSWTDISNRSGRSVPNVIQAVKRFPLNRLFVLLCNAIGYDVKIMLVKGCDGECDYCKYKRTFPGTDDRIDRDPAYYCERSVIDGQK